MEADIASHINRLRKLAAEAGEAAVYDPVARAALLSAFCDLIGTAAGRMAGDDYQILQTLLEKCADQMTKAAMKVHFRGRIENGDQGGLET